MLKLKILNFQLILFSISNRLVVCLQIKIYLLMTYMAYKYIKVDTTDFIVL